MHSWQKKERLQKPEAVAVGVSNIGGGEYISIQDVLLVSAALNFWKAQFDIVF